jgi:hypothetical protein
MSDITPQGTQAYGVESGYEVVDANVKDLAIFLVMLLVSVFVVMAAMVALFNYLNNAFDRRDAALPVSHIQTVLPAEPHLLPSVYTSSYSDPAFIAARKAGLQKTPDVMPWDKRDLEIVNQYDEVNSYAQNTDGTYRIPIAQAIENAVGGKAAPSAMAWQQAYPRLTAGTNSDGTMNLKMGTKIGSPSTFDDRPIWESPDERFTVESTGGASLHAGELSR